MKKPIRAEEIQFMSDIERIIKDNFNLFSQDITSIELSTTDEDTKESFDLVYKSKIEISVRIRNNYYLKFCDFTIRSKAKYNGKTELDKILEGKGSIYLYAWKDVNNKKLQSWVLIDINKIRPFLKTTKTKDISNNDGTYFKKYYLSDINDEGGLIKYYHLPPEIKCDLCYA